MGELLLETRIDFEEENHLLVVAIYRLPSWARRKKGRFGAPPLSSRKPLASRTIKGYVISIELYNLIKIIHLSKYLVYLVLTPTLSPPVSVLAILISRSGPLSVNCAGNISPDLTFMPIPYTIGQGTPFRCNVHNSPIQHVIRSRSVRCL